MNEIVDKVYCPIYHQKEKVFTIVIAVEDGELAFCRGCDFMSGANECRQCIAHYTRLYSTCINNKADK